MTSPNSPLTLDHLQQIKNSLSVIEQAEAQISLAERAGIDMTNQKAQIADSKAKLLQIKSVYFPGQ